MADRLSRIADPDRRRAMHASCHLLAGLAFSQLTIDTYLPVSILEQSVTYQAATRRGEKQGLEQGRHVEAAALALRLLRLRIGPVAAEPEITIRALPLARLEALVEDLLAFSGPKDLAAWLQREQP